MLDTPRARFYAACAVGALLATIVFAWMVFLGSTDLTRPEALANFYEVQARSLLHGHWDVPPNSLSFERFKVDGHFYLYQGPWPAVLRMPVVAVTDGLDGQLSRLSMLLAFVIFLCFTTRLAWQARSLLRGEGPPTRASLVAGASFVFVAGCGSSALFLGSRSWVYHEAILWGISWSIVSLSFLVAYLQHARPRDLWLTCVAATLAVLSRGSVGAGAVLVLGTVLALQCLSRAAARFATATADGERRERIDEKLARWCGVPRTVVDRPLLPSLVALVVPVGLYAYVNYEKFGSLFGLPIAKQDLLLDRPARQAALEESATLFSPKFAPTNLLQYLRPDAIGFDSLFPWVTFSRPLTNVGAIPFDNIEPSASITAVSSLLVVLAVLGVVAVVRAPRGESESSVAVLRLPMLAFAAVTGGAVLLGVHFQRYEGDFLPALVVAGVAGLFFLPVLLSRRTIVQRRVIAVVLVVLGVWSCWATFSLALRYQRTVSAFADARARQDFVGFQLDVADAVGGRPDVSQGSRLPYADAGEEFGERAAPLGAMFVLGDCEGLYVSSRKGWEAIEQRFPGSRRWSVAFDTPHPGAREPLWSDRAGRTIWARWVDHDHVTFEYDEPEAATVAGTEQLRVRPGRAAELDIRLDPSSSYVEVKDGERVLLASFPPSFVLEAERLGRQPDPTRGARRFDGSIEEVDLVPLCRRVLEHLESSTALGSTARRP